MAKESKTTLVRNCINTDIIIAVNHAHKYIKVAEIGWKFITVLNIILHG